MQRFVSTAMGRMLASLLLLAGLILPPSLSHAAPVRAAMTTMAAMPGMTMGCDATAPQSQVSCHPPGHHHTGHAGESCCTQTDCTAAWLPAPTAQAPPALRRTAAMPPLRATPLAGRTFAPGPRPPRLTT
ncbi:hypothetical protein [Gluconacetobacter takamatsuzukensis]|uniref:Uncharacterized protein n=1 Tax=Gluconacetobacter takamatsuzukensis TaxID=1286190 RepID=A0A7W4PRG6_9PROT|nr:hypothetical protein [Gluconacetobacter takamatsuzukensis]MBB2205464.1 hypothetical protein [Gluconacetobacter takamatsuzukensis]